MEKHPKKRALRIAILDLYDGYPNQGMQNIRDIIAQYAHNNNLIIESSEFDVRRLMQIPDHSYDAYISSGGPGSPIDSIDSLWEKQYFDWLESIEKWNNNDSNSQKKHILFICHSFQLACRYYQVGLVCKRKSTSFGIFPIHQLENANDDAVFEGLKNTFYAVDSRDYQVISPNYSIIEKMGGKILSIEKERPHVPFERAIMAVRFNKYFVGTQFHPEADPIGMSSHLQTEERKQAVINNFGEEKWASIVEQLHDPEKISWTHNCILPNFLNTVLESNKL